MVGSRLLERLGQREKSGAARSEISPLPADNVPLDPVPDLSPGGTNEHRPFPLISQDSENASAVIPALEAGHYRSETLSRLRGQSERSSRDRDRSARSRPWVWQRAQ